ncbi:MAG: RdgB/HAM1 family non-canonical purine NTP pyrophosphatase [Deltaproteobacteria bacterium]|nr:RdgB/HAM1 family non-canonical purine NTP pyrophosphatase [Deltaproteobacteria bacterium]
MPARRTIVVATGNRHKLRELRQLFADLPVELVSMADASRAPIHVVEDEATFEGNARKKAKAIADALAMPALADDSGLEVDALDGAPGVRSARFAGEGATDAENNRKLLAELDALGPGSRTARFHCVLVLHDPIAPEAPLVAHGRCEGEITANARGAHGFGYDPIFIVREGGAETGLARTMAELGDAEKNAVSHRSKAARALAPLLRRWLGV